MTDLLQWTNEELEKGEIHPLLVIGAFVYEFLSIHPFQDGNGRLSRLLTTLLLLRKSYDFVQYGSLLKVYSVPTARKNLFPTSNATDIASIRDAERTGFHWNQFYSIFPLQKHSDMATTSFAIASYQVTLFRDNTGSGASSPFDAIVTVRGEGNTVHLHFLNSDTITSDNVWVPAAKFGRIYLRHSMLPVTLDLLRNEKPMYCIMSNTIPSSCRISTSGEPIGEEET